MKENFLTQESAPTLFVELNGINFAYRKFGAHSEVPLLFLQHFLGNIDDWDPDVTNKIAGRRTIILFNNKGVASSSGKTPDNVVQMTEDVINFINALNINKVDILGYSLGGFIAQQMAVDNQELIRKLILAGTAPQGSFSNFLDFAKKMEAKKGAEKFLFTFFTPTIYSRSKGMESLKRIYTDENLRDSNVTIETMEAQTKAIHSWGTMKPSIELSTIKHPTFIVNGSNDEMMHTENSYKLFQQIPGSILSLYPDSAHGALFQYLELFVEQCNYFLDNDL